MKRIFVVIFIIAVVINLNAIEVTLIKKLATGHSPKSVEITPDGKYAYVNNLESCALWKYSVSDKKVIKKIEFFKTPAKGYNYETKEEINSYAEKPVECDFAEGGRFVYLSLHNGEMIVAYDTMETDCEEKTAKKVKIKDLENNTEKIIYLKSAKTGKTPKIVKVSPDEKWIYVANWFTDDVTIIERETFKPVKTIPVVHIPRGIDFSPDSKYAYIVNMGGSTMTKVDICNNHKKLNEITIGLNPRHIVISTDGKYAYTTHNSERIFVKTDLVTEKRIKSIDIGTKPRSFVITSDNKYAFILVYEDDKLVVVNLETMTIEKTLKTGLKPIGVAITPDNKELWLTNYFEGTIYIYSLGY